MKPGGEKLKPKIHSESGEKIYLALKKTIKHIFPHVLNFNVKKLIIIFIVCL